MNLLEKFIKEEELDFFETGIFTISGDDDVQINYHEGDTSSQWDVDNGTWWSRSHWSVAFGCRFYDGDRGKDVSFDGLLKFYLRGNTTDDAMKQMIPQINRLREDLNRLENWLKEKVFNHE